MNAAIGPSLWQRLGIAQIQACFDVADVILNGAERAHQ
jgi:hypothetical protein